MDETLLKRNKKRVFLFSLIIFLISLTLPAFYIDRPDYNAWSSPLGLILIGWIPAIGGEVSALSWFANPLIVLSWISLFKFEKIAIWTGIASILFAVSFLFVNEIISSEAPTYSRITEYKLGYWLWLFSMISFVIGIIRIKIINK